MHKLKPQDLFRVQVRPGDRFVLNTRVPLSRDQHAAVVNAWRAWTAPLVIPLLVLPEGMRLSLISGTEIAADQVAALEVPRA